MPGWARLTDKNNAGAPILSNIAKSVIINGLPAAMLGSIIAPHAHVGATIIQGSLTVTVEGRPAAFQGALQSCGDKQVQASLDVQIPGL